MKPDIAGIVCGTGSRIILYGLLSLNVLVNELPLPRFIDERVFLLQATQRSWLFRFAHTYYSSIYIQHDLEAISRLTAQISFAFN